MEKQKQTLQVTSDALNQQEKDSPFQYYIVKGIDMCGGDIEWQTVNSEDEARQQAKLYINKTPQVCCTMFFNKGRIELYKKDMQKTNPQSSNNHLNCWTMFYGERS